MEQNSKKPITLKSLYSMVIDSAVSGYLYTDHQGFGIPYLTKPRYSLYIRTYSSYIRVTTYKKQIWICKYGQAETV